MTTNELVDMIVELLKDGMAEAEVGRVGDENCIGVDIGGNTWFIEIQEG